MNIETKDAIDAVMDRVPHAFWRTHDHARSVYFFFTPDTDMVWLVRAGRADLNEADVALDIERCVSELEAKWAAVAAPVLDAAAVVPPQPELIVEPEPMPEEDPPVFDPLVEPEPEPEPEPILEPAPEEVPA